jgi:predicted SAM-dependent methyltransferase
MEFLNLGCGTRFIRDWTNIDFKSHDPIVKAHNLMDGIPLPDKYVNFIYQSHLLEHFPKHRAPLFLKECLRVLKPGGIIRVVVPDLEGITRAYLESLKDVREEKNGAHARHEWMMIELLDQLVREKPGGEMWSYLTAERVPARDFILDRLGVEAENIMGYTKVQHVHEETSSPDAVTAASLLKKLVKSLSPEKWRAYLLRRLLGKEYAFLEMGRFRSGGEVHQWMYDSCSLGELLKTAGFVDIVQRPATESYISDWHKYYLDVEPDGSIYKPDSLYMEGRKRLGN